ncbi:MAG: radical SAM protein [Promethearchaeati archaeon SRVP18_Atabeyarchaeia-1]
MSSVESVRVSLGTAGVLGLLRLQSNAEPTTAYLMTYTQGSCRANCGFCPQASGSSSTRNMLSRVVWPDFSFGTFLEKAVPCLLGGKFQRICIQALNYPKFVDDVTQIAHSILSKAWVPISVSCPPIGRKEMEHLKEIGVERIGIPIDAATPELFERMKGSLAKGPYHWDSHFEALKAALAVFGRNKVSTHLIVGLGETERDIVEVVQNLSEMGVNPGLFAFTPVKGTRLEKSKRPEIGQYRRVQVARYLIMQGTSSVQLMTFEDDGRIMDFGTSPDVLHKTILLGYPFRTSGCPGCNRPFYNESPRGPLYNYPRDLNHEETEKALREIAI